MTRPALLIWGAGGHAKVVADIVRAAGQLEIIGFLDDTQPHRDGETFHGAPLLGGLDRLDPLVADGLRHVLVAIGDCAARLRLSEVARAHGLTLATAIHPSAVIAPSATLGPGSVVAPLAAVNADARIGASVIVNTAAVVEHDCRIGDGVHLSPRVTLGGGVCVGRGSWIGIGATVRDHISIGARTVVGAGAVVVHDLPDNVIAYGVPARIQEHRTPSA